MVINQNEKQNQNINLNKNANKINNDKNMKIDIIDPDIINSKISNNNLSYEKLPSNQRNTAYGNNNNRINNFKKENEKNYYNLNAYQNQNRKNRIKCQISSIKNHNLTYDYEEQTGNLSMLNNNTTLLNMNNNNIFIDPRKTNESGFIPYNDMNLSLNLPNKEKNFTNLQNYMIQFPPKEEPQNINLMSNINPKRNRHVIGTLKNWEMTILNRK